MSALVARSHARPHTALTYASEAALVEDFATTAQGWNSPWGALDLAAEFDYASGRADLIALTHTNELLTFEAKLTRWRDALHQAFRNTFFASRSYVVLPLKTALRAAAYRAEFERRNVGLCSTSDGVVQVLVSAPVISCPVQPWLATQAVAMIRRDNERIHH